MHIIDFTREHITNAKELALLCYKEEQSKVPVLPKAEELLDLTYFADNGFGAAAYEGKTMIGFLCGTEPFDHAFGSTDAKGIFSPMGANAAAAQNRADIYAAIYQYVAQKWVKAAVFVGMYNYMTLFGDEEFWKSLVNTCIYTVVTVPVGVILSLITAVFLNASIKGKSFFRVLYFLPRYLTVPMRMISRIPWILQTIM